MERGIVLFRENIGENLRLLRKKRTDLSVAKIVDIINDNGYEISADTYYKWERGTRKPPCEAIPYIAQALGTSEAVIFHLHEGNGKNKYYNGKSLFEEIAHLPADIIEILSWLIERKDRECYSIFFLAGMYASMNKSDRNLISNLIIRLYEHAKEEEILEEECTAIDWGCRKNKKME